MAAGSTTDAVAQLYRARAEPAFVEVPPLTYLSRDGHGDPNTSAAYATTVQALYAVSYAAKFAVKRSTGEDFTVSPLEGLWWSDDMSAFTAAAKDRWDWTMMIRQPASVTADLVAELAEKVSRTKGLPAARDLRLAVVDEGTAAQVLHVGPYAAEGPTIARLHDFIHEHGFTFEVDEQGLRHHEIYLGDPRRAAPEKLRTIIRQPCRRQGGG
jgi:hypothetical protein